MSENNISVERDFVGTLHIKVGDFDYVQIQYQHPFTDNASTRALADRIVAFLAQSAEAEGVDVVGWIETKGRYAGQIFQTEVDGCEPLITVAQHLAALSAVTAERDRLREEVAATNRGINAKLPRRNLAAVGTGALHAEQNYCYRRGWKEGVAALRAQIRAAAMAAKEA